MGFSYEEFAKEYSRNKKNESKKKKGFSYEEFAKNYTPSKKNDAQKKNTSASTTQNSNKNAVISKSDAKTSVTQKTTTSTAKSSKKTVPNILTPEGREAQLAQEWANVRNPNFYGSNKKNTAASMLENTKDKSSASQTSTRTSEDVQKEIDAVAKTVKTDGNSNSYINKYNKDTDEIAKRAKINELKTEKSELETKEKYENVSLEERAAEIDTISKNLDAEDYKALSSIYNTSAVKSLVNNDAAYEKARSKRYIMQKYGLSNEQAELLAERAEKDSKQAAIDNNATIRKYNNLTVQQKAMITNLKAVDDATLLDILKSGEIGTRSQTDLYYEQQQSEINKNMGNNLVKKLQLKKELKNQGFTDKEIDAFLLLYDRESNGEYVGLIEEEIAESDKPMFGAIGNSVASVVLNDASGKLGALGLVKSYINSKKMQSLGLPDMGLDTNDELYLPGVMAEDLRKQVTDEYDLKIGNWDAFDFVYNTAMSWADSLNAAVNPMSFGAFGLASNAGASGARDATEKGLGTDAATANALANAATEYIFEKISLGQLDSFKEVSPKTFKGIIGNIAKSRGVNASEELATEAANIAYDTVVNGGYSDFEVNNRNGMKEGLTQSEAYAASMKAIGKQLAEAAASGALMGTAFGAVGSASGYVKNAGANKYVGEALQKSGQAETVVKEARASDDKTVREWIAKINKTDKTTGQLNAKTADIGAVAREMYSQGNEKVRGIVDDAVSASQTASKSGFDNSAEKLTAAEKVAVMKPTIEKKGGKVVSVSSVESVMNGNITVKDSDGNSRTLDINSLSDKARAVWQYAADNFTDPSAVQAFVDNYEGGSVDLYSKAFKDYFNLASAGMTEEQIKDANFVSVTQLTDSAISAAVEAGHTAMSLKSGVVDLTTQVKTKSQKLIMNMADTFGQRHGMNITFVDTLGKTEGFYKGNSNQIVIALDASGGAISRTLGHETFHYVKQKSLDRANEITDFVVSTMTELKGTEWVEERYTFYEKQGYKTREAQIEEFVADSMFDVFSSERAVKEFVQKDRTFAQKVVDHIKSIIADIKNIFNKLVASGNYDEISAWQSDMEALDKLNNMMLDALAEIEQSETQAEKNTSDEVQNSTKRTFSYEELTSKPDMKLTVLSESVPADTNGKIDRGILVNKAIQNVKTIGHTNKNGNGEVFVKDVGCNVAISKASIRHGIDRRIETQAPVLMHIGEVISNSIEVNQLNPKKNTADSSYILLGAAKDGDNIYVVSSVVNGYTNSIDSIDVLYSANIKKESAVSKTRASGSALQSLTDSTISISDLLDIVKDKSPEILSNDVLKHYGLTRGNGEIENALMFSTKRAGDKAKSPDDLTESDVKLFLTQAIEGNLHEGTYFPVRRNTPRILIDSALRENGDDIDNLPVIIQVKKATAHGISPEDMISIIKGMDDPQYIIYQEDNDRYVEVVKYDTSKGSKAVAVLEIGDYKSNSYLNGYPSGSYNVLVTAFEPNKTYVSDMLSKTSNAVIYEKKKGAPQVTSGSTVPLVLNESPFADIIPQNPDDVNAEKSTLEEEISLLSERFDSGEDDIRFSTKRTVANGKKKSYNKNSYYNEFNSLAMQWRYKADTQIGDMNIISGGKGGFALLKATEDGYVELARGDWTKVKELKAEYERAHKETNDTLYNYSEELRVDGRTDTWNMFDDEERGYGVRNSSDFERQGLQINSSGSDEHSGQGDRGESITYSTKRDRSVSEDASNYILDTKEYKEAMKLVDQRYRLTGKKKLDARAIDRFAGRLLSKAQSQYSREQLTERLSALFDYIANSGNDVSWDSVMEVTANIASDILKQSQSLDRSMAQEYKGTRDWLKGLTVYISPEVRAEIDYRFGSLENFRRKLSGKVKITVTDSTAISLDSAWKQLAEDRPEMFDEATSALDQPEALADFFDMVKPQYINPYDMDMDEAAYDFALQIYDEYFNIPEIRTEAQKYAQREEMLRGRYNAKIAEIRKGYENRMSRIRSDYQQKIKNVKAEDRERYEKLRSDKNKRIEETKALYRERNRQYREKRNETQSRQKLRAQIMRSLKSLTDKLVNPTDTKHIPQELIAGVNEFAKALVNNGAFPADRAVRLQRAFNNISEASKDPDYNLASVYDEEIAEMLTELSNTLGNKKLGKMSSSELQKIRNIAQYFNHIVSVSNRAFIDNINENISTLQQSALNEISSQSRDKKRMMTQLQTGLLKPVTFFEILESATLEKLYTSIRKGEEKWARTVTQAKEKCSELKKKYNYKSWGDTKIEISTVRGQKLELSVDEALSVYATSKREQGVEHITKGGIVKEEEAQKKLSVLKKKNNTVDVRAQNVPLSVEDIHDVIAQLSQEQKAYADELVAYMSNDMAALGNEVSMTLYGYQKFNERYYFPIKSASNFLYSKPGVEADARIKHMSMTKKTVPKANNPVIIGSFTETAMSHCNDMALYHGLALPLEDFNRVYNYRTPATENTAPTSIKQQIDMVYGEKANKYIKQLLTDINGGVTQQAGAGFVNKLISKAKKNAVFGSLSVAVQQPSSVARAMAYVDPKYFAKTAFSKRDWEQLKKYAPVAVVKEMGYFDTNIGKQAVDWMTETEYDGLKEKAFALLKDSNYRDDVLSFLPAYMDEVSWGHIWNAVKAEIKATRSDLDVGSEEFYQAAAERFTYVIDRTQVYDSVFSRSEWMRSKDTGMKMATAFMSEPLTNYNMLYTAAVKAKNGDKKFAVRAVTAYLTSVAFNSLLKSLVTAGRDDDEDKSYWEKYLSDFVGNFIDEPLGMIPYLKDLFSILQGYDSSRMDTQVFADIADAAITLFSDNKSPYKKVKSIVGAVGIAAGVPFKNIWRDAEMIIKGVADIFGVDIDSYMK